MNNNKMNMDKMNNMIYKILKNYNWKNNIGEVLINK